MDCHPVYVPIVGERMLKLNVSCLHIQSVDHIEAVSSRAEVYTTRE